jgi:hypothetical protein
MVGEDEVKYIGSTRITVYKRMAGYFSPGDSQATNLAINPRIIR